MTRLIKTALSILISVCLLGGTLSAFATTYKYDALGRVIQVTYDSGVTVYYTYDAAGNIISITTTGGTGDTGGTGVSGDSGSTGGTGGSTSTYPEQISVSAPDSDGNYTAQIPEYVNSLAGTDDFSFTLGSVTVTVPVSVLKSALDGGSAQISAKLYDATALSQGLSNIPNNISVFGGFELTLGSGSSQVHELGAPVTVTVNLSQDVVAQLKKSGAPKIHYYDPSTKTFTDMNAVFDLVNYTATFKTTHFSTYVIAVDDSSVPVIQTIGVTYRTYVQKLGWQPYVNNGVLSGTMKKSLRVEALNISLTGNVPKGTAITYQTYVQKIGWQKAVSNGAMAGTSGKSLRIEALKITLSGLDGYRVRYRAYVQGKGWLGWQTTQNGTDIKSAGIAGTMGKSLRIEAIEVVVEKVK